MSHPPAVRRSPHASTRRPVVRVLVTALATLAATGTLAVAEPAGAAVVPLVKVNFQPTAAPVPTGYVKDTGAGFDAARGFGWVRQDSLQRTTHVALDLTANTRDRNRAGIDQRLDTLIHMQYGDVSGGSAGNATPGAWEHAVTPGTYAVTVSAGDRPSYDSVHVLRVEGVTAVDAFRSTAAAEYRSATVTVPVADGRLTVDAVGGTNTKLNYVDVARVTDETVPPAAPSGLTAVAGDRQVALAWTANGETDLLGYRVRRGGTVVSGSGLVTTPSWTDTAVANGAAQSYQVTAVDKWGNESAVSAAASATPAAFALKVDFADQASTPAAGYVADYGQAYGARGGGRTFGWVRLSDGAPVSLVGNGRNRGAASDPDPRVVTLMHAQLPTGAAGVAIPGMWELAVPNASYTVTVGVGDVGGAVDSNHFVSVEDQNAVAAFVPTSARRHVVASRTVTVADGRLTLSPAAGTNTKLTYVDVASVPASAAVPAVRRSTPGNLTTGVDVRASVVNDLRLPFGGIDPVSLTASTVKITRVSDGAAVAVNAFTSGGSDVINASPLAPLAPTTLYRFEVTSGVRDVEGNAFAPHSVVFTTGTGGSTGGPAFTKVTSGAASAGYTTVTFGPDGRLYAATIDGFIHRYAVAADGTLSAQTVIDTVREHAVTANLPGAPGRTVIGMAFDPASTPTAPILWVSDNYQFVGTLDVPDWSSKVARLSGPDLSEYQEVLTDLPRSVKDHETNSMAFGPDGALYVNQGANNAMGAPDAQWGNRPEQRLSAAILRLDPAKLPGTLPVNVKTSDGGTYDPAAAGAPLTLYATGVRNAYDLVWHRNGHLYVPTNGSASSGNAPATPATLPPACQTARPDGPYTGPAVPAITNNPQAETDYVFDVKPGRYYGHPNPSRCEWALAGGNPTGAADPFQMDAYPAGTAPDRNLDLAGIYDAGLHASADGAIEYRGGALNGKLLVVRYSNGQDIETFDVAASGALSNRTTGITGFTGFNQPLDLTQQPSSGNIYVAEIGGQKITLLRPVPAG